MVEAAGGEERSIPSSEGSPRRTHESETHINLPFIPSEREKNPLQQQSNLEDSQLSKNQRFKNNQIPPDEKMR